VNQNKTELVVFKNGERLSADDEIYCRGQPLRKKNMYKYLGITIQVTGKSFSVHIQERLIAAVRCINDIKNLQLLSLKTAIRLFEVKVLPTLTYGLEIIWDHLAVKQLESLESLKARYLKRTMGLSKYTPSRLEYALARETFLLDDLMLKHLLPRTSEVKAVLRSRKRKQE
jgi:hypothetical protein